MIKVNVSKDKIKVNGHSGYSESGSDIVCSSVSSIVITTVNAILRLEEHSISYEEADGMVEISILKHNHIVDTLVLNMVELLKELEKEYSKYIKIW
jgi:uncharacterized protein YsxB (DUF464 family)